MRAINNFENVQASTGESKRPTAGGYIITITAVKDFPFDEATQKGDYLRIEYDIAEGEFAGYYTDMHNSYGGEWFARFISSYKESAQGMFKHFINCIEDSNRGYVWNWNEQGLVGKVVGVVLGEEEYRKKDGSIGTKLVVKSVKTAEQIVNGDFKIPAIKKIEQTVLENATQWEELSGDEKLPF